MWPHVSLTTLLAIKWPKQLFCLFLLPLLLLSTVTLILEFLPLPDSLSQLLVARYHGHFSCLICFNLLPNMARWFTLPASAPRRPCILGSPSHLITLQIPGIALRPVFSLNSHLTWDKCLGLPFSTKLQIHVSKYWTQTAFRSEV